MFAIEAIWTTTTDWIRQMTLVTYCQSIYHTSLREILHTVTMFHTARTSSSRAAFSTTVAAAHFFGAQRNANNLLSQEICFCYKLTHFRDYCSVRIQTNSNCYIVVTIEKSDRDERFRNPDLRSQKFKVYK